MSGTTLSLRAKPLRAQERDNQREKRLSFEKKMRILDALTAEHRDCNHGPEEETYRERYLRTRKSAR